MCKRKLIAKYSLTNNVCQREIVRGNQALLHEYLASVEFSKMIVVFFHCILEFALLLQQFFRASEFIDKPFR